MGTLNLSQAARNPRLLGEVSLSLVDDLPARFTVNPLRRTNRVNLRLRDEDIAVLEDMALKADMPFQAFLGHIIHQYASSRKD